MTAREESNGLIGPAHPSAKWRRQIGEGDLNPDNEERRENEQHVYISQCPVSTLTSSLSQSPERVTHLECHQTLHWKRKLECPHLVLLCTHWSDRSCTLLFSQQQKLCEHAWPQGDGRAQLHGDGATQVYYLDGEADFKLMGKPDFMVTRTFNFMLMRKSSIKVIRKPHLRRMGNPSPFSSLKASEDGCHGHCVMQTFIMTDRGKSPAIKV